MGKYGKKMKIIGILLLVMALQDSQRENLKWIKFKNMYFCYQTKLISVPNEPNNIQNWL